MFFFSQVVQAVEASGNATQQQKKPLLETSPRFLRLAIDGCERLGLMLPPFVWALLASIEASAAADDMNWERMTSVLGEDSFPLGRLRLKGGVSLVTTTQEYVICNTLKKMFASSGEAMSRDAVRAFAKIETLCFASYAKMRW